MAATLPPIEDLKDALQIATVAEAGAHLHEKLQERVEGVKPLVSSEEYDRLGALVDKVEVFASSLSHDKNVLQHMEQVVWRGKPLPGPEELAELKVDEQLEEQEFEAMPELPENDRAVAMRIQFDESGALNRGYLVDGKEISKKTADVAERLDNLFHGWLVHEQMLCESQHIYRSASEGGVLLDDNEEPVMVGLEEFKERAMSKDGLESYVNEHARGLKLEAFQVDLPGEGLAVDKAAEKQVDIDGLLDEEMPSTDKPSRREEPDEHGTVPE